MAENHKIVYLIVETGSGVSKQTFWRQAGVAYPCRDGSFNLKLDIHPTLIFNIRDPKSNGEKDEVYADTFVCEDCVMTFPNEEAHALNVGGAVCDACYKTYKDCEQCNYCFPKALKGTICPKCKGGK